MKNNDFEKWRKEEIDFNRKALASVPLDSLEYSKILTNVERLEKLGSKDKEPWWKSINPNTLLIFAGTTLHLVMAMRFEKESILPKAYQTFGQRMRF